MLKLEAITLGLALRSLSWVYRGGGFLRVGEMGRRRRRLIGTAVLVAVGSSVSNPQ